MRYLIMETAAAERLNRKVARANGAGTPDHVTQFWFSATEIDGETMLEVADGQERHLSNSERVALTQGKPERFEKKAIV